MRTMLQLVFFLIISCAHASEDSSIKIVLAEGQSFIRKGKIHFNRPEVGSRTRINPFGQFRDKTPIPAQVTFDGAPQRLTQPNDVLETGDILQTNADGYLKLLIADVVVVDIAPLTTLQIDTLKEQEGTQAIWLRMLSGNVRVVVAPSSPSSSIYRRFVVSTPNIDLRPRGTEFFVLTNPSSSSAHGDETTTEALCIHGEVIADVRKQQPDQDGSGLVYLQPYVLRPSNIFSATGPNGFSHTVLIRPVSGEELRGQVRRLSPLVNVFATSMGTKPHPSRLPGTGKKSFEPNTDLEVPPTSTWWLDEGRTEKQHSPRLETMSNIAGKPTPLQQLPTRILRDR